MKLNNNELKEKIEKILDKYFRNRNHYNFSGISEEITEMVEGEVSGFASYLKKYIVNNEPTVTEQLDYINRRLSEYLSQERITGK